MAGPAAAKAWTTRRLLAWMGEAFTRKGLDSPRLCAEILLSHVIGCERLRLYMDQDRPASPLELEQLRDLARRALQHEPVQYLTGEAWFFGMPFHVDSRVLIPRPATETLVEHVLQHARSTLGPGGERGDGMLIADVGAGSGCIAVALAKHMKAARFIATDVSNDALELARENATRHGVKDRIEFLSGDLLEPLRAHPVASRTGALAYLASNPPYIPDDEWKEVPPNVKEHEPTKALRGGHDGMDLVRPILEQGPAMVRRGGLVIVEVAESRVGAARKVLESNELIDEVEVLHDFEGLERVVVGLRT